MSVSALTRALTLVCLFFSINAVMYNIKANLSVCVFVCFCFHFCTASFQRRRRTRTEVDPAMASTPPPGRRRRGFCRGTARRHRPCPDFKKFSVHVVCVPSPVLFCATCHILPVCGWPIFYINARHWLHIGWIDVTESKVTICSPFCGYNLA